MDTSNGGNASRRESVSHSQPVIYDSPSCRRTTTEEADAPAMPEVTIDATAQSLQSADRSSKSYAYDQDRKHNPSLSKRSRDRSHRPRQKSSGHSSQSFPSSAFLSGKTTFTDLEIDHQLLQLLEQEATSEDGDLVAAYSKAAVVPPITHESLAELDIGRIINNPKLRHDVNFDKELHFRPNLDGSRGRQKIRVADDYWRALIAELMLYRAVGMKMMSCTSTQSLEYWSRMMRHSQKRIPVMFETIRDILKTLVPERDQAVVAERMDVAMIMQEISKGVFDMMSLAQWLATLLKAHCAPMRDEWIDQMVCQVAKGIETNCQKRIVIGLRQLLGILEAMKLDIANHQIRHLRAMLIEDGVNFQTKYHLMRLHHGRFDPSRARRWYLREHCQHLNSTPQPDKLHVFVSALFKSLLSQSSLSSLPETFALDADRLRTLRADLQSIIYTQICLDILESQMPASIPEAARSKARAQLRTSLLSIVGETRSHADCVSNIAVEVARLALAAQGSTTVFDGARIDAAEVRLRADLKPGSLAFLARTGQLRIAQTQRLERVVRENISLSPLTLHDRMFAPQQQQGQQAKEIDAVLRRICHVAVLHWHIWAPLVYDIPVGDAAFMSPVASSYDSEGSSASGSDTESEAESDVSEMSSCVASTASSGQPPSSA